MKISELKEFIKENVIETLSEASPEEVKAQADLNAELEKTVQLKKDAGIMKTKMRMTMLKQLKLLKGLGVNLKN